MISTYPDIYPAGIFKASTSAKPLELDRLMKQCSAWAAPWGTDGGTSGLTGWFIPSGEDTKSY